MCEVVDISPGNLDSSLWFIQARISHDVFCIKGFPGGSVGKESTYNAGSAGDADSIPGPRRSPGWGHGTPFQYFCVGNPIGRGAWWTIVHRITKSHTWVKQLGMHACMLVKSRSQHWSPTWQKWSQRNGMSLTESASPLDSKDHEVGICLTHSWMLLGLSNTINTSWMIG